MDENPYLPPSERVSEENSSEPLRHSRLAVTAFAIALAAVLIQCPAFFIIALLQARDSIDRTAPADAVIIVSGMLLVGVLAELAAIVLGIASLFQRFRNRAYGVLGIMIGAVALVAILTGFAGRVAIGLVNLYA